MFKYENLTPSIARSSPPSTTNAARFFQIILAERHASAFSASQLDATQLSSQSNEYAIPTAIAVELGFLIINATVTNEQSDTIPVEL